MRPEVQAAYLQLTSVGLLWVSFHCAGMCGPILTGLDVAGHQRGTSLRAGLGRLLSYQGGRVLTYGAWGMWTGLLGAGLRQTFSAAGAWLSILAGVVVVGSVVVSVVKPRLSPRRTGPVERPLVQLGPPSRSGIARTLKRLVDGGGAGATFLTGIGLGFMPCMIPLWVLSLAAQTGSPLHGGFLMVLLVVMTTPILLGVTLLPRVLVGRGRTLFSRMRRPMMALSGCWMVVVGLAGAGVVSHAHASVSVFGRHFTVMFW